MLKLSFIAPLALCSAAALNAASVTYTYVGSPFVTYGAPDDNSHQTNLSVSITLASALGANFNNTVTPASYSLSDGFSTITDQSPNLSSATYFTFQTDAGGEIDGWDVAVEQNQGGGWLGLITNSFNGGADGSDVCTSSSFPGTCEQFGGDAIVHYQGGAPAWTATSETPEPSAISLLGAAVVFGFGLRRFRRNSSARA
jgi:hypothetical protein